ncbi:MAG: PBP1A family penicillin-binding protein [Acidobacteria bacterium]|nr:PBP1A family penicillin-binding protein [Acidobacteriota bacterium]
MHPAGKLILATSVALFTLGLLTFTFYYVKFSRMIDEKLAEGPFPTTSMLFSAPKTVRVGDETTAEEIVGQLRRSGYGESKTNRMGWYHLRPDAVEVFPGPDSFFDQEAGVIKLDGGRVVQVISLRDNSERTQYLLEPELITNLFDRKREKRRIVRFPDIPKVLVNAVVSVEDKRFFQHAGFDPLRILKSAYVDIRERRHAQGASTLSMQLARSLWLTNERTWRRKIPEVLITLHLEQKLTKEEIFEYYANTIDVGRRGSFAIRGFGEAAQAYFGKDLRELTLAEAATLAGLVNQPSWLNPLRWPDRARARRNVVLLMMRDNGYIADRDYAEASASPLALARTGGESLDAPYFVDMVNDDLQERFQAHDFQSRSYRVYTTLDLNLQRAAAEAVRIGMQEVDTQIRARYRKGAVNIPEAQVALVALDPQTGEVKALIGGRNYGLSQLNRALAKRQPGSVFKPFVYAAALNTAVLGGPRLVTTTTTVMDEPTTFWFDNKPYEPNNYKSEFHGLVNVRQALSKSMNVPTVKVAEMIGYDNVVELARQAGMNLNIQATPAVALGAYEVTPVEVAGAYSIFADGGVFLRPNFIKFIRDEKGTGIYDYKPAPKPVLDPRVSYLMVDLMEEVLRSGTGAAVRARGFGLPAAGKTGTSHDGWFAGFTSKLICVVWVGFDDNKELHLEGARSALPIWTEFMKRAHEFREYRNVKPFEAPNGIVSVLIDPATGQLAANCPNARPEVFLAGTQPLETCRLHGGRAGVTQVAGWDVPEPEPAPTVARRSPPAAPAAPARPKAAPPEPEKKKGFFSRIRDLFR